MAIWLARQWAKPKRTKDADQEDRYGVLHQQLVSFAESRKKFGRLSAATVVHVHLKGWPSFKLTTKVPSGMPTALPAERVRSDAAAPEEQPVKRQRQGAASDGELLGEHVVRYRGDAQRHQQENRAACADMSQQLAHQRQVIDALELTVRGQSAQLELQQLLLRGMERRLEALVSNA